MAKDRKGSTADWMTHPLKKTGKYMFDDRSPIIKGNENSDITRLISCTAAPEHNVRKSALVPQSRKARCVFLKCSSVSVSAPRLRLPV